MKDDEKILYFNDYFLTRENKSRIGHVPFSFYPKLNPPPDVLKERFGASSDEALARAKANHALNKSQELKT